MKAKIHPCMNLRQQFLNYFRRQGHRYMPPSKIYNDDPTLFFVNSGMCPLKSIFLGEDEPKEGFVQLMNSQICVRAGGKHNDLEDVGQDSYHLTLFEMLGNWSLNDYGKERAIELAYQFLVDECHLNPAQMYVTYFEGTSQIPEDTETREIWKRWFPEERILKGSFRDNFWVMAEEGPCGPCTEIHYDLMGGRTVPEKVNREDPTVIEIWNLVFTSYRQIGDAFFPLGKLFVDTGMGLERLSMILEKKTSLYQTSAFRYLIGYAQVLTQADFYKDTYGDDSMEDIAYRIFADHIRTVVVALHQGVKFDCTQRGFVLRKIFRRLLIYTYRYLLRRYARPVFDTPLTKCLISDILDYFLLKEHEVEIIEHALVEEEKLFLGKLRHAKKKYQRMYKKILPLYPKVSETELQRKVREQLKSEQGLGEEITCSMEDWNFV